ncbi:TPA: class F sortase [Candidatus Berkelbacteria bacterium]|uniref:Peptidase C60 family protein n=1 Tax=Berkelbacteria bacterium GW2011_GWE1_39_12 TaxID=1618337 RepID=A0A0G4B459_9BACT|nr:MAG: peptidase C60 family protein [Berkelbacteria bacterium GW2011_GWE1_39_12]HBO60965.1 class F sortase [Candidatus Berkelbacteria bacterium]
MQPKISLGQTPLIAVIIGFVLSLTILFCFVPKNTIQSSSTPFINENKPVKTIINPDQEKVNYGLPMRLKIPEINVDATIDNAGLTPDGTMESPKSPSGVVWYKLGARPGEIGSAVIAGHYGTWKNGEKSVFDDLSKLNPGDKIYIEDDMGKTTTFVLKNSQSYDPSADASGVFNSNDGKSHLNLVTCEGIWNPISQSYSKRLVMFADKE